MPSLPFLHFNLGVAYMHMSENEKSEAEFKKDIAIEPDLADNYERLGMLYMRLQRDAEAEKSFREALERDPSPRTPTTGWRRFISGRKNRGGAARD